MFQTIIAAFGFGGLTAGVLVTIPLLFAPPPADRPEGAPVKAMSDQATAPPSPSRSEKNGVLMSFEFLFPHSTGTVEICLEGYFVTVRERWRPDDAGRSRWRSRHVKLVFDAREKVLTILNLDNNEYTELTESIVDQIRKDLAEHHPTAQTSLINRTAMSRPAVSPEPDTGNPTYIAIPEKHHPTACRAFERTLPRGLHEESCYTPWITAGIKPANLEALKALRQFIRGLDEPLSELEVISAVSDALAWDLGLVVSQYKFGKSPLAVPVSDNSLDPWDRVFTLTEARPHAFDPEELHLPGSATRAFGIVPWPTPMFNM